jgi:hypothetical protein
MGITQQFVDSTPLIILKCLTNIISCPLQFWHFDETDNPLGLMYWNIGFVKTNISMNIWYYL